MGRYDRNMNMLSKEENEKLKDFRVCVLGCGGLGGYAIEMLGRLGIGYITAVDKDVFEETNLNRQILSDMNSLGKSKALMAVERMKLVNPEVFVNAIVDEFNFENGKDIIKGHDIVIDALDNIEGKLTLQDICEELGIPFVHGAIAGWYGQVTTVFPGDKTLKFLYKKE
jgi:Dinucleotide-utilizing enzymes involved in molybdopterin and thiamine biosynthesis family 2